jgi:hypothetical protein
MRYSTGCGKEVIVSTGCAKTLYSKIIVTHGKPIQNKPNKNPSL